MDPTAFLALRVDVSKRILIKRQIEALLLILQAVQQSAWCTTVPELFCKVRASSGISVLELKNESSSQVVQMLLLYLTVGVLDCFIRFRH